MNLTLMEPTATVPGPARAANVRRSGGLWRVLAAANFLALVGVALLLRGWQLGNIPGLNGDEAWLGVQAAHLAAGEPIAWRTPTGNPVNLFLLLPVAALHLVFGPGVVVLRVMAVVSGVATLGANFWLCRRVFDRHAALVSTAVLAVLPIAIAYSRFAWDTSQTILATVLVLYYALSTVDREVALAAAGPGKKAKRWPTQQAPPDWLPALLAFGVAIWIHPTNVFALWLLLVPAVYRYGDDCLAAAQAAWQLVGGRRSGRLVRGLAMAMLGMVLATGGWFCRGMLAGGGARLVDPEQGGLFLRRLVRLFSGGTILEFIPGPARTSTALDTADVALLSLVGVAALGLMERLRRPDSARERCLAWAVALMVGTFYVVAGPDAIAPHFERYGMCLIAPGAVLLALGWSHWLGSRGLKQPSPRPRTDGSRPSPLARAVAVVLSAVAWLWLAHFYCDYFLAFRSTGGASHVAFRTAAIEPKLAALETIVRAEGRSENRAENGDSPRVFRGLRRIGIVPAGSRTASDQGASRPPAASKQIWIVADSWWSYWPLAYFAAGRHDIHVVAEDEWPAVSRQVAPADGRWRVKFVATSEPWLPTAPAVTKDRPAGKTTTIRDYSGGPLLSVERLDEGRDRRPAAAD